MGGRARDRAAATLTVADAQQYLRRFPFQGHASIAFNALVTLAGNAFLLWLLWSGQIGGAALIALVLVETVLLAAIAWAQQRTVPVKDWLEPPKPWREKLPVLLFMLVWLGGAYTATLLVLQQATAFLALFTEPEQWIAQQLHWPLAITLAFAAMHAYADARHYRQHGGPFHSTVSHDALSRYMTLLLGAIPFAMPFFAVTIGGFKTIEYVARRMRADPSKSIIAGVAMMAVGSGSFAVVQQLIDSGVSGWAVGYVFAKLISEWFIVGLPLIMVQVIKEGDAAPANKPSRRRGSRLP